MEATKLQTLTDRIQFHIQDGLGWCTEEYIIGFVRMEGEALTAWEFLSIKNDLIEAGINVYSEVHDQEILYEGAL